MHGSELNGMLPYPLSLLEGVIRAITGLSHAFTCGASETQANSPPSSPPHMCLPSLLMRRRQTLTHPLFPSPASLEIRVIANDFTATLLTPLNLAAILQR